MSEAPVESMAGHRPAVRAFVRGLVGGDALAEDLTQEAFVRAQRAQAKPDSPSPTCKTD